MPRCVFEVFQGLEAFGFSNKKLFWMELDVEHSSVGLCLKFTKYLRASAQLLDSDASRHAIDPCWRDLCHVIDPC